MRKSELPSFYLLVLACFTWMTSAAKCAAPALSLPYRNTSVAPGVLVQGIPIQIGSPPQYVALTPSLMIDNTLIPRYTNSCVSDPDSPTASNNSRDALDKNEGRDGNVRCADIYGGGYEPELSQTWKENKTSITNMEPFLQSQKFTSWDFIDETFEFSDYLDVYTHTMDAVPEKRNLSTTFMLPDGGTTFGILGSTLLGLTPNSTLLRVLHEQGMIASRSWSLTNETLCLGCIEQNAHTGDFQTSKPADRRADEKLPCLLQKKVEMLYWYPNADTEGTFLIEEGFQACIDPGVKFLVLPDDVRGSFAKATERELDGESDDHFVLKGSPGNNVGLLNFRFEGGMQVNASISGAGGVKGEDGEWKIPIGKGGWGAYGLGVWTLGKPFTDRVVLAWDSETQEYKIANINEDPVRKEDLKPLGCNDFPVKSTPAPGSSDTAKLVGSVVGGFLGGVVFALAGFWFFKRGAQGVKSKYEPMGSDEAFSMGLIASDKSTRDRWTLNSMKSGRSGRSSIHSASSSYGRVSPLPEPQLVADNPIYEAPEGGTGYPTKRIPTIELGIPSAYQR